MVLKRNKRIEDLGSEKKKKKCEIPRSMRIVKDDGWERK